MTIKDIKNEAQLWDFMTDPPERLVESLSRLNGPVMVLGGSGKMGKELVGLIRKADDLNKKKREIHVASTFSNPDDRDLLKELEINSFRGDLSDEKFLDSLPESPFVIYMMGFKFGSSGDWRRAFHLNSIVPYLTGLKYRNSRIVVFSSGNPYPHTPKGGPGCGEEASLDPQGIYGWSIIARESSFQTTALKFPTQKSCFFRLMYAQHLYYGVLVDLAKLIYHDEPVSLHMPSVNLVSQRDANEIAIRALEFCDNPPAKLNIAGPVWPVQNIAGRMGKIMGKKASFSGPPSRNSLLASDDLAISTFGPYRDKAEDMIDAAALWVMREGKTWDKPTYFGKVRHDY